MNFISNCVFYFSLLAFSSQVMGQDAPTPVLQLTPITNALDKMAQVDALYVLKDGQHYAILDRRQIEAAMPDAITIDSTGKKTIDFEQLGAITLAAMKDQQMIIDEQEARIRQLEAFEIDRKVLESEVIRLSSQYHDLIKRLQHLETKESLEE